MLEKLTKAKEKTTKTIQKIRKEHLVRQYLKNNQLFIVFVLICVLNSTLLRFLTMHTVENYVSIKPIIADFGIVVIIGSFSYLFKDKKRYTYLLIWAVIFTAACMINSIYYTFYTSFASFSMLSLAQFIAPVGDAVVENVLQLKDLLYLIPFFFFVFFYHYLIKNI